MRQMHPVYSMKDIEDVQITHRPPENWKERAAKKLIYILRSSFDKISGYDEVQMSESKWLTRCIFLEAVAGVPGMVGGMTRHLKSLRTMRPDHGIIHHLLEEAENERTHLFMFISLKEPSVFMRAGVVITQGLFWNFYFLCYLASPRFCHSLVGYLEEEAVHTYSMLLKQLDEGKLKKWQDARCPQVARDYYELDDKATVRDMFLSVRADESIHRDVNHRFSELPSYADFDDEMVHLFDKDNKIFHIVTSEEVKTKTVKE